LEIEDDDGNEASKKPEVKIEPEVKKPFLNRGTENFNKCLAALKNGIGTIEQVESKYIVSAEVKAELVVVVKVDPEKYKLPVVDEEIYQMRVHIVSVKPLILNVYVTNLGEKIPDNWWIDTDAIIQPNI
jgi:hypothetical protein